MESTWVFQWCQLVSRDKDQHCGGHRWASPPALSKPDPVNPFCAELEKPLPTVTPTAQKPAVHPSPTRFSRAAICCSPGAALHTVLFLPGIAVGRGHSEPQAHRLAWPLTPRPPLQGYNLLSAETLHKRDRKCVDKSPHRLQDHHSGEPAPAVIQPLGN